MGGTKRCLGSHQLKLFQDKTELRLCLFHMLLLLGRRAQGCTYFVNVSACMSPASSLCECITSLVPLFSPCQSCLEEFKMSSCQPAS